PGAKIAAAINAPPAASGRPSVANATAIATGRTPRTNSSGPDENPGGVAGLLTGSSDPTEVSRPPITAITSASHSRAGIGDRPMGPSPVALPGSSVERPRADGVREITWPTLARP